MYNIEELQVRLLSELREIAEELNVKNFKKLPKKDLIYKILDQQAILPEQDLARWIVFHLSIAPDCGHVRSITL
jgi:transcription termination factor Rho